MMANHDDFEVLCALAASADLTAAERTELNKHLEHCILCRGRLSDMRNLGRQLFLAQAQKGPGQRLPAGMRERFSARAIREGIPLRPRPQGVGFSSLGLVTALLLVLLLVAATLKGGSPLKRSVAEPEAAVPAHAAHVPGDESGPLEVISNHPRRLRARHQALPFRGTTSAVQLDLTPLQARHFTFTPYSRDSGMRVYPFWAKVSMPEIIPAFAEARRTPVLTLDISPEVFQHTGPPNRFRFDLASAPPAAQSFLFLKAGFKSNLFPAVHNPDIQSSVGVSR